MPGTFKEDSDSRTSEAMGPPVAPKSRAPNVTLQSWQQAQRMDLLHDDISDYGNHVRCGSVDSVDSGSSVSSSSSSGSPHLSNENDFILSRTTAKAPVASSLNPLQFVKVQAPLYRKTDHQIKLVKDVKLSKDTLKETEEEWQSNLDNWKSRRRKVSEKVIQRAEEMRQVEAEEQLRQLKQKEQQRKIKTFSQIVEKRSSKRSYNLDLYIGQGDDSGIGETPEPDEQEGTLDSQHLHMRSDTSEGMTSETDSIDSDAHCSDKMTKEPPKVPKKPHSWLSRKDYDEVAHRSCSPNDLFQKCLTKTILPPSETESSAEPSDVEGPGADIETVSSEDDMGFCRPSPQVDSGLESIGDGHRPNDSADSASDLSQDSCSGSEKICPNPLQAESNPRFSEVESRRKRRPLLKSVSLQDEEYADEVDVQSIKIRMVLKHGCETKGYGFTVKGGKDHGYDATVDSVIPGSVADLAGLKKGDKVLTINDEDTLAYSHASLAFSIKQATHSGELELLIRRSNNQDPMTPEPKKTSRRAASFAEKLAMFSGRSTSSISFNSLVSSKASSEDESKQAESLVLKRRSAFERSKTEYEDMKNRRSSCVSPEDMKTDERRLSVDLTRTADGSPEDGFMKKPPPPVPAKPKLKAKLSSDISFDESVDSETLLNQEMDILNQRSENGLDSNERPSIAKLDDSESSPMHLNRYNDMPVVSENRTVSPVLNCVESSADITEELIDLPEISSALSSPELVDNAVNNVQEISECLEDITLNSTSEECPAIAEEIQNTVREDVSYLEAMDEEETVCSPSDPPSPAKETYDTVAEPENAIENGSERVIDEESQVANNQSAMEIDSSACREHFMQVHPLGLPLEKIDEDDGGVSASTTTSSDTPDTETVIDNLPTTISPLPNDDAIEILTSNGMQYVSERVDSTTFIVQPLENLEVIAEENSFEEQDPQENEEEELYVNNVQDLEEAENEDQYELDERADQLSPLDVIDQIEMRLMQQLEQDMIEDLTDDTNGQLEDEVNRQLLYLSDDADLLDDYDAPRNMVPPSEPPPPPPPEPEISDLKANPFQRINSTKRIKKELWRRRSDFLGLDSPEAISVDDLPPPPPGLEELLKSEMELQREQRLFLEKQLSLNEAEYTSMSETSIPTDYSYKEDYTSDYMLEVLDAEVYDAVADDPQPEDWKIEDECQIPEPDEYTVIENNLENTERENKLNGGLANKAKNHIQSLGAAPRAKIMDSNKWITQSEKHGSLMKQKSVDPVFRDGAYNQNFWLAQEAQQLNSGERAHVPVDRRYSMPPAYSNNRQPNVVLRTWDDRESQCQPPLRPKSAVWRSASNAQPYPSSDSHQRFSWNEGCGEEQLHLEVNHQCSYCGSALTEGSAMGIDALQLYFHIECFRCSACRLQLGNGTCGTDVQVKNSRLYCPKCFLLD